MSLLALLLAVYSVGLWFHLRYLGVSGDEMTLDESSLLDRIIFRYGLSIPVAKVTIKLVFSVFWPVFLPVFLWRQSRWSQG